MDEPVGAATLSAEGAIPNDAVSAGYSAEFLERNRNSKHPLVTTRVGVIFVAVAVAILACAIASHTLPDRAGLDALMWISAITICSFGGLVSMRSVRTLRTIEAELRLERSGKRRWQSARPIIGVDPITDGWNELIADIAHAHQCSEQSRVPAALDHEVVTLARAMRGLPVAWIITDTDGRIRFLGPAACGLLALDESESHDGQDLTVLLGLRDETGESTSETLARMLSAVRMVSERHDVEIGSQHLHIRITRSRLSGRSGDGEGMAWVLTDETQQRLATNARDEFVMTATHELRTPLTNLQAYAEALQGEEGLEVERQKEFCNVITSEAIRLGRLVDQLLTVSQMEAGSMTAHRHELEMLPMLEYAADQLRGHAEQKQMKLATKLSAKLPIVIGDRDKLQAALVNLVGNAIKYTPEGGEVVLRAAVEDQWIRIDIEDNGPGIPEDEQEKVFNKFFRGNDTRDSDQRGNGLGLAFSREIARLHGGDIELQSTVGEGSTFTLKLPIGGQSRSGI